MLKNYVNIIRDHAQNNEHYYYKNDKYWTATIKVTIQLMQIFLLITVELMTRNIPNYFIKQCTLCL